MFVNQIVVYTMFAIHNEEEDVFFNAALDGWVNDFELEGDCLFPTEELAQKYIDEVVEDENAVVYEVKVDTVGSFEYKKVKSK